MRKKIALIGSTGSIGRQVINVALRYPERFEIVAMAANPVRFPPCAPPLPVCATRTRQSASRRRGERS